MEFVDTHCHIQLATDDRLPGQEDLVQNKWRAGGFKEPRQLIEGAAQAGVTRLLCVGCTLRDSRLAVDLAVREPSCSASIGIHPHEAKDHASPRLQQAFADLANRSEVVAIGECGLDYYYLHSPKASQRRLLEFQLDLAQKHKLPVIFHVRDAFDDFWPIFDQFPGIKGVIHSFTAGVKALEQAFSRNLYIGLNGIVTFTKVEDQIAVAKTAPLDRILLETDAPFLTPTPYRGTICQPKHVVRTAEFLAGLRGVAIETIAGSTTRNAQNLFKL